MLSNHPHPLKHLAIIMDGNNRWARERGLEGIAGHEQGVEQIRKVLDACQKHNIETLTLFAFSSENWSRPTVEVRALMSLFALYLKTEVHKLAKNDIRLRVIGRKDRFSNRLQKLIADAEYDTRKGSRTLVLAADYGGKWDISNAAQMLAQQVKEGLLEPESITEGLLEQTLSLGDVPAPDLCIRTAGEKRISNFLIWQLAYSELYFTDCFWPDFDQSALDAAVADYYQRQRRFGMTAEQVESEQASA